MQRTDCLPAGLNCAAQVCAVPSCPVMSRSWPSSNARVNAVLDETSFADSM
jgi:hypothetical protein